MKNKDHHLSTRVWEINPSSHMERYKNAPSEIII